MTRRRARPHLPLTITGRDGLWLAQDDTWVPYPGPPLGPEIAIDVSGQQRSRSFTARRLDGHGVLHTIIHHPRGRPLQVVHHLYIPALLATAVYAGGVLRAAAGNSTDLVRVRPAGETERDVWDAVIRAARPGHSHANPARVLAAATARARRPLRAGRTWVLPQLPMRRDFFQRVFVIGGELRAAMDSAAPLDCDVPQPGQTTAATAGALTLTTLRARDGHVHQILEAGGHRVRIETGAATLHPHDGPAGAPTPMTALETPLELLLSAVMDPQEIAARRALRMATGEPWTVATLERLISDRVEPAPTPSPPPR